MASLDLPFCLSKLAAQRGCITDEIYSAISMLERNEETKAVTQCLLSMTAFYM